MTTDKVKADTSFKSTFETFFADSLHDMSATVNSELSRKLCNTRLAEFLDGYKQTQLSWTNSGSASLAGQNLRDT